MAHPAELYLAQLAQVRGSGAALPEVSGYPALVNLLDAVGATLRPKVTAISQLADTGADHFGLFTPDQLRGASLASRGVAEVKAPSD